MPNFRSPIDVDFKPLKYDKFGVLRPASLVGDYWSKIPHSGVDLRPHENGGSRNVYAIENGIVTKNSKKEGMFYTIDHGSGWVANYVHLNNRPLAVGTRVKKGQLIGSYSTQYNHLHLTLIKDSLKVDPEKYINLTTQNMPLRSYITDSDFNKLPRDYQGAILADKLKYFVVEEPERSKRTIDSLIQQRDSWMRQYDEMSKKYDQLAITLREKQATISELEFVELKEKQKDEAFRWLPIWRSLMRDGYVQTLVGAGVVTLVGYITSQIPELAGLQDEIVYSLLGILGIQGTGKQIEKLKK